MPPNVVKQLARVQVKPVAASNATTPVQKSASEAGLSNFSTPVKIGSGQHGKVYRVNRLSDGIAVCLKMAPVTQGNLIEDEYRVLSALAHPGLPKVHSFFTSFFESVAHRIMEFEYIPGQTLKQYAITRLEKQQNAPYRTSPRFSYGMSDTTAHGSTGHSSFSVGSAGTSSYEVGSPLRPDVNANLQLASVLADRSKVFSLSGFSKGEVLLLALQLLNITGYLHSKQVCHADIKPENIMVVSDSQGFPVIKLIDMTCSTQYIPGDSIPKYRGTPNYLAPEIIAGCICTPKIDMFSIGAVLYQLCTGEVPFKSNSVEELSYACIYEEPNLDLIDDSDLRDLIGNLLSKDPASRLSCYELLSTNIFASLALEYSSVMKGIDVNYVAKYPILYGNSSQCYLEGMLSINATPSTSDIYLVKIYKPQAFKAYQSRSTPKPLGVRTRVRKLHEWPPATTVRLDIKNMYDFSSFSMDPVNLFEIGFKVANLIFVEPPYAEMWNFKC